MFEDSLVESLQRVGTPRTRWTAAASITLQAGIASLLIVLPLLHPESLPRLQSQIRINVPSPAPPPIPQTILKQATGPAATAPTLARVFAAPRITPSHIETSPAPMTATAVFRDMGTSPGILFAAGGENAGRPVISIAPDRVPSAKKPGPVCVSAGVSAGLLLTPIRPVYPQIARASRIEGTVIVEATISRLGSIESLHVLSGPAMLQGAAIEAIRSARYQPFRLNGEPTEVQTTITVNFKLGS